MNLLGLRSGDIPYYTQPTSDQISRFVDFCQEHQLLPKMTRDFHSLKTAFSQFPKKNAFHLGFDPDLNPDIDGVWLYGEDRGGAIQFSVAARAYKKTSYLELLETRRVWYPEARTPEPEDRIEILLDPHQIANVKGTLGMGGMLWLHPDFRGKGLSAALHACVESLMLGLFDYDYYVVVIDDGLVSKGVAANAYRFQNLYFGTRWSRGGKSRDYWIAYNSRADVLKKISQS